MTRPQSWATLKAKKKTMDSPTPSKLFGVHFCTSEELEDTLNSFNDSPHSVIEFMVLSPTRFVLITVDSRVVAEARQKAADKLVQYVVEAPGDDEVGN